MTRTFFRKGIAAAAQPHPPKQPKKPPVQNRGRVCVGAMTRADGVVVKKLMSATKAQQVLGAQKGGQMVQEGDGSPSRFTSESGRKAALKLWYGEHARRRFNKKINRRIGGPSKNRPPLNRAALRARYAETPTKGITCRHTMGVGYTWWECQPCTRIDCSAPFCSLCSCGWMLLRQITERTALRRLGHLNYARINFVPENIQLVPLPGHRRGTKAARSAKRKQR